MRASPDNMVRVYYVQFNTTSELFMFTELFTLSHSQRSNHAKWFNSRFPSQAGPFHLLNTGLAQPEVMDGIHTVINERRQFFLQIKKLFFGQIRTFKNRLLYPDAKTFQGLDHPVTGPVITDIITDNVKHDRTDPIIDSRKMAGMQPLPGPGFPQDGGTDCA